MMAARTPALEARIDALYRELESQPMPLGSLRRLWSLGGMNLAVMSTYLRDWLRRSFSSGSAQERSRAEVHLEAALRVLATMGYLRGLVMKIGQAAAQCPRLLPREIADVLANLQFQAPPMHHALIREQVQNELGADPRDVFSEFEPHAFRAASLGQVHRARLHTGERVAVKIQYPGIARTIEADMRNLRALLAPVRLFSTWHTYQGQIDELVEGFTREVDYTLEARTQTAAARLFRPADGIRVPRVFPEYSTARILVSELVEGVHLEEFMAGDPPRDERIAVGERVWRVVPRMIYGGQQVYSDVHPGNFIVCPDRTVALIDFGNVRTLDETEMARFRQLWGVTLTGTDEEILEAARVCTGVVPPPVFRPAESAVILDLMRWLREPLAQDAEYAIEDSFLDRGALILERMRGLSAVPRPPEFLPFLLHTTRAGMGQLAFLHRLQASWNLCRIHREEAGSQAGAPGPDPSA